MWQTILSVFFALSVTGFAAQPILQENMIKSDATPHVAAASSGQSSSWNWQRFFSSYRSKTENARTDKKVSSRKGEKTFSCNLVSKDAKTRGYVILLGLGNHNKEEWFEEKSMMEKDSKTQFAIVYDQDEKKHIDEISKKFTDDVGMLLKNKPVDELVLFGISAGGVTASHALHTLSNPPLVSLHTLASPLRGYDLTGPWAGFLGDREGYLRDIAIGFDPFKLPLKNAEVFHHKTVTDAVLKEYCGEYEAFCDVKKIQNNNFPGSFEFYYPEEDHNSLAHNVIRTVLRCHNPKLPDKKITPGTGDEGLGYLCSNEERCNIFCESNFGQCKNYCREYPETPLCQKPFAFEKVINNTFRATSQQQKEVRAPIESMKNRAFENIKREIGILFNARNIIGDDHYERLLASINAEAKIVGETEEIQFYRSRLEAMRAGQKPPSPVSSSHVEKKPREQEGDRSFLIAKREIDILFGTEDIISGDHYERLLASLNAETKINGETGEIALYRTRLEAIHTRVKPESPNASTPSGPPQAACDSNPTPTFTHHITDMSKVNYVVPPPTMGAGPSLKPHSYIGTDHARVPFYAPTALVLESGSHYVGGPYMVQFKASCEVRVRFGHITEPIERIKALMPSEPKEDSRDSALKPLTFEAGELLGYTTGTDIGGNWDFGVYNSATKNRYADDPEWNWSDTATTSVCPFDYFPANMRSAYTSIFDSEILGGNPPHGESFCK